MLCGTGHDLNNFCLHIAVSDGCFIQSWSNYWTHPQSPAFLTPEVLEMPSRLTKDINRSIYWVSDQCASRLGPEGEKVYVSGSSVMMPIEMLMRASKA